MTRPLYPTRSGIMARLGVAFLTWRRYLQRNLAPHGVTLKQHYVLRQLEKSDYLYPSDIAEALFCDRPTATVILDNLEKQGWIQRQPDPENRRYTRISITPGGRAKMFELQALPGVDFDPLEPFTEEELREFSRLLAKLNHHLDQIRDGEGKEETGE
jgi:DNA-binding MarR family transcriptional regulator